MALDAATLALTAAVIGNMVPVPFIIIFIQRVFIWLRSLMRKRLDGTTGDTAGALLEIAECAVLVALAC